MSAENSITQTPATVTHDLPKPNAAKLASAFLTILRSNTKSARYHMTTTRNVGLAFSLAKNARARNRWRQDRAHRSRPRPRKILKIAQHNGWSGITVDGDEQFRRWCGNRPRALVWRSTAMSRPLQSVRQLSASAEKSANGMMPNCCARTRRKKETRKRSISLSGRNRHGSDPRQSCDRAGGRSGKGRYVHRRASDRSEQEESLTRLRPLKRKAALVFELNEVLRDDPARLNRYPIS
jgi:hypothetical protein